MPKPWRPWRGGPTAATWRFALHCAQRPASAETQAGSEHLADAHVIAVAVELGGGLALTADAQDLGRLAASYGNVAVVGLP